MRKRMIAVSLIATMFFSGCSMVKRPELLNSSDLETQVVSSEIRFNDVSVEKKENPEKVKVLEKEGSLWNFSYGLLKENITEENPVLSPVSAYLALGMTGLGAAGDTLEEFETVLGSDMHEVSEKLIQTLPAEPGKIEGTNRESKFHINLANSVWVDTQTEPLQSWLDGVSGIYEAQAYRANLSDKATMNQMNDWIEKETQGLIKKFLAEPLDSETRLALFNTIYFFGEWQYKFEESSTIKDIFVTEDGTQKQVEMMREYDCYRKYVKQKDFDGVILPYRDSNMVFVALKPTEGQSVRELYQGLSQEMLSEILSVENTTYINLKLPKFEVTFDKELNETLQNMGIVKAFDDSLADFSNMATTKTGMPLYISLVRQKAVIRVDEEGTEAAAVTMVAMQECAAVRPIDEPIDVFFDEPFLYMIMDMEQEVPLFMGIMDCPQ